MRFYLHDFFWTRLLFSCACISKQMDNGRNYMRNGVFSFVKSRPPFSRARAQPSLKKVASFRFVYIPRKKIHFFYFVLAYIFWLFNWGGSVLLICIFLFFFLFNGYFLGCIKMSRPASFHLRQPHRIVGIPANQIQFRFHASEPIKYYSRSLCVVVDHYFFVRTI